MRGSNFSLSLYPLHYPRNPLTSFYSAEIENHPHPIPLHSTLCPPSSPAWTVIPPTIPSPPYLLSPSLACQLDMPCFHLLLNPPFRPLPIPPFRVARAAPLFKSELARVNYCTVPNQQKQIFDSQFQIIRCLSPPLPCQGAEDRWGRRMELGARGGVGADGDHAAVKPLDPRRSVPPDCRPV